MSTALSIFTGLAVLTTSLCADTAWQLVLGVEQQGLLAAKLDSSLHRLRAYCCLTLTAQQGQWQPWLGDDA